MLGRRHAGAQAELGFDPRTRRSTHPVRQLGVRQDAHQPIGESVGIARGHQVARVRLIHDLWHATHRGAHRRPPGRHRLQQRIREALDGVGTQDEHVHCPENLRDIRAGPRQHHALVETEFTDKPFDFGSHRALTDDQELRIRHPVNHQACGPKKRGVVLLRPQHREDPDDLVGFADTEIGHRAAVIGPLETVGIDAVGMMRILAGEYFKSLTR